MLLVVHELIALDVPLGQVVEGVEEGVDGAVPLAVGLHGAALVAHLPHDAG